MGQEVLGLGWGGGARVPEDKMDALSAKLQGRPHISLSSQVWCTPPPVTIQEQFSCLKQLLYIAALSYVYSVVYRLVKCYCYHYVSREL